MKLEFKGVFPAPPTPVAEDGRINEKALRALLDDNISHGCGGFWMAGSTGEVGLTCFSGNGAFPLPALTMGAVGTIDAPPSIAPWHYAELFSAWEAGNMTLAQSLQDGVRKYVDLVWMFGAPADVCKTVLSARLGVDCGHSIPPVNRLTDEQRREVLRVAEALGVTASRRNRAVG